MTQSDGELGAATGSPGGSRSSLGSPSGASAAVRGEASPERRNRLALTQWLPDSTLVSVRCAGFARAAAWGSEHRLVSTIERLVERIVPQVDDAVLERVLVRAQRGLGSQLRRLGLDKAGLRALLGGPFVVAVGRPALVDGVPMPSIALLLDRRADPDAARRAQATLESLVRRHAPLLDRGRRDPGALTLQSEDLDGYTAQSISGIPVWWAAVDGVVVVSQSRGCLAHCLAVHAGRAAAARDRGDGQADRREVLSVQLHGEPVRQTLQWFWPYELTQILEALGVTGMDGVHVSVGVDERAGDFGRMHIAADLPRTGMIRSAIGAPVDHDVARACPPDTAFYGALRFNPTGARDGLRRVIAELPSPVRRELGRVERHLDEGLEELGLAELNWDRVLGALGRQVTVAVTAPMVSGRPIPEGLLFLETDSASMVAERLVQMIERRGPQRLRQVEFQGRPVWFLRRLGDLPISVSIAARDRHVIVGSSLMSVKAALRRMGSDAADDSLAGSPEFRAATAERASACMFGLVRLREHLPKVYRALRPMIERGIERELGFVPDGLPTTEELDGILVDWTMGVTVDGSGLTIEQRGPVGFGAAMVGAMTAFDRLLEQADAAAATGTPSRQAGRRVRGRDY